MRLFLAIIAVGGVLMTFTQCRKDVVTDDPNAKLAFSNDTILFDTIFTTVGSTTQWFRVYNNNANSVVVSSVSLAGGASSPFRINLDGVSGIEFTDIEIEGGDSLYLFAEVTLQVNSQTNPLIIEDSIIFETNGNRQVVKLVVWGQDAYFHVNDTVSGNWANDKPHVIYGIAAVGFPGIDSNATLNIPAGTHIHVHANSLLYVYKSTLNVNGAEGNEVIFEGDRLEPYYSDIPGQWDGIWLIHSENSLIDHAIIKNSNRGIWAFKTNPGGSGLALTLRHTEVRDAAFSGIWLHQSKVDAENSLFADCGSYCGVVVNGGEYDFNFCTFANYWNYGSRSTPGFLVNNYTDSLGTILKYDITNTLFQNCIFYGNRSHEFGIDTLTGPTMDFRFEHCILLSDETTTPVGPFYNSSIWQNDPGFEDPTEANFMLTNSSFAKDKANGILPSTNDDIDANPRSGNYDIGCYEYQ